MDRTSASPTQSSGPLLDDPAAESEKYPDIQRPVGSRPWGWPLGRSLYDRADTRDNIELRDQKASSSVRENPEPGQKHHFEWVKGIHIAAGAAGGVLALNIILTATAAGIAYSRFDGQGFNYATLYRGSCEVSKNWTIGLHLLINVLSTVLMGASSYCMQYMNAPSREDVDIAHSRRVWLNIGSLSVRNLWYAPRKRKIIWGALLVTSLPFHTIYNCAVFSSKALYEFHLDLAATDDIHSLSVNEHHDCFQDATGQPWAAYKSTLSNSDLDRLNREQCFDIMRTSAQAHNESLCTFCDSAVGTLLFLSKDLGSLNRSLLYNVQPDPSAFSQSPSRREIVMALPGETQTWNVEVPAPDGTSFAVNITRQQDAHLHSPQIRDDATTLYKHLLTEAAQDGASPDTDALRAFLDDPTNWRNRSWAASAKLDPVSVCSSTISDFPAVATQYEVDGCLAQRLPEKCELMFSLPVCLAAIACNVVKLVCMLLITHHKRETILLTVGDAISSFLEHPDSTTHGRCAMSRLTVETGDHPWKQRGRWASRHQPVAVQPEYESEYPEKLAQPDRWMRAAKTTHWTATVSIFLICLGPLIYLSYNLTTGHSSADILAMGFGETDNAHRVQFDNDWNPLLMILLANTPQLVLSVIYFLYNNLLTRMLAAAEYSGYATARKALRVTWPKGAQRSTYYLSVPYRYAVPLLVLSSLLHWLVSQSFFYVRIVLYDAYASVPARVVSSCAISIIPVLIVTVMAVVVPCSAVGIGLRRFGGLMPMAGHCSAAISAACHPPTTDGDAQLKEVMWGETAQGDVGDGERSPDGDVSRPTDKAVREGNGPVVFSNTLSGYYRHCTFTSCRVLTPNASELYA